jgi:hypothetical protein
MYGRFYSLKINILGNSDITHFYISEDKTNQLKYELYVILVEEFGTAFPISYCLLQTAGTNISPGSRMSRSVKWMACLCADGHKPTFTFSDKVMAQIGAWKSVRICIEWFSPFSMNTYLSYFLLGLAGGKGSTVVVASKEVTTFPIKKKKFGKFPDYNFSDLFSCATIFGPCLD